MYYVYIIECQNGAFYTGVITDVQRRFKEHSLGKGGAYTRANKVKQILYIEKVKTRSKALKREFKIKSWTKNKKLALIKK